MAPTTIPRRSFWFAGHLIVWLARLLLGVMSIVAPAWAADDPPGRVGRVTESQGQSWFYDADANQWTPLERNRPISTGDRLAVDGNGRLELRIGSTAVRLAGGSELEIVRIDDERIDLYLHDGSVAVRTRSPEVAREVGVASAVGRFWPLGPGHFRVDLRDDANVATAWLGDLHFDADDSALDIAAGRSAELWREGANNATHYSWREPESDEFADWTARADREDERVTLPEYVSSEMTGAEDLNRYGTWESNPEYGPLWIPTTVVAGWAPYRYGHWVFMPPWGWTWVDDAPWGFAPFHYGRWVYFGSRWCWAPGVRVARPVYAPAMVAWVSTVPPGRAPWPYVGWVPLAPREPYYPHYATGGSYWRAVNAAQMKLFPPGTPRRPPTSPALYANQGVSGAVSVVPGNALVPRRPVAPVVAQVDPTVRSSFANQPTRTHVPPPGVARPIAVPGASPSTAPQPPSMPPRAPGQPPGPRPPGRQPSPALMGQPGNVPDARRGTRTVPAPPMTTPPRATITPPAQRPPTQRPPTSGQPSATPPRVTVPTRPTGPQATTTPAAPRHGAPQTAPTPAAPRAPAPAMPQPAPRATPQPAPPAQPESPRAPQRIEPGDTGNPRTPGPGRSSGLPAPQARAMPAPPQQHAERAAPPRASRAAEAHRAPQTSPPAQARARVPEWRGHPSRAQMQ